MVLQLCPITFPSLIPCLPLNQLLFVQINSFLPTCRNNLLLHVTAKAFYFSLRSFHCYTQDIIIRHSSESNLIFFFQSISNMELHMVE